MHRLFELVPHAHNRDLPLTAQPEGAVVEQKVDAVLLGLDRIVVGARADHLKRLDAHLIAAGRPGVGPDLTRERDRRLLRELRKGIPRGLRHLRLHQDRLQNAGAITHDGERHFSLGTEVRDPRANGHDGAGMMLQVGNASAGLVHRTTS